MHSNSIVHSKPVDLRLKCPFSMIVCGASNCGKTTWVYNLLKKRHNIFNSNIGKIVWFYKIWQNSYEQNKDLISQYIQGMCTMEWLENNSEPNMTVVIDDMAMETTADTAKIFTAGSHHFKVNVIFITQNLFPKNRFFRDISLNTTYLILFKNVVDKMQIKTFAVRYMPGNSKTFMAIYNNATSKPHSYLLLDNHQETEENYRILSNYLEENSSPVSIWIYE